MIDEEKKLKALADVTKIATDPGNAHADPYMLGMANGLILAKAIFDDTEPDYMTMPRVDRHNTLQAAVNRAFGG